MKDEKKAKIRILHVYRLFALLLMLVTAVIIVSAFREEKSIVEMQSATNDYVDGQNAISDLMTASDYLTDQARAFVVSGDPEKGRLYQEEVDVTKRRNKALDTIRDLGARESAYVAIDGALKESNKLMSREYYAMLLSAVGHGLRKDEYEEFTKGASLTKADLKLSDSEKRDKAITLMFDSEYEEKKNEIRNNVAVSLNELLSELSEKQVKSYNAAVGLSRREHIVFILTLLGILILMGVTAVLIINPLVKSARTIIDNDPLPTGGAAEFSYLAEAYNKMLLQSIKHQEKLSYEATHDELTGLYNRKLFEARRKELENEDVAMLILDVDYFKEVNDTYGHETGDRVLKKVGAILSSSFRIEDCVCRIGGDEFAVIMRQIDPSLKYVVQGKIESVRDKLIPTDDLPKVTLSIGAAFTADEGEEENLFKKADKALYSIKEHGRDGYAFYGDM